MPLSYSARDLVNFRPLLAEFLGSALLVMTIIGSGISAERLSPENTGLQLLESSLSIMLGLGVLISVFGPISGAHFNPVVSVAAWLFGRRQEGGISGKRLPGYICVQIIGAIAGCVGANAMFGLELGQVASKPRFSLAHGFAEVIATAGLILVIFLLARTGQERLAAPVVGAYIGSAIWFTSSTAFANPAVTIGRVFTDTFAGIAPGSVPGFILAQAIGAGIGVGLVGALFPKSAIGPEVTQK